MGSVVGPRRATVSQWALSGRIRRQRLDCHVSPELSRGSGNEAGLGFRVQGFRSLGFRFGFDVPDATSMHVLSLQESVFKIWAAQTAAQTTRRRSSTRASGNERDLTANAEFDHRILALHCHCSGWHFSVRGTCFSTSFPEPVHPKDPGKDLPGLLH